LLDRSILENDGIVVMWPDAAPTDEDIDDARAYVDLYLENHASIHGVLIAGWEGIAGLIDNVRFVRDYHTKIERVALVTDTYLPPGADAVAKHFVEATIKHFSYADYDKALKWLKTRSEQSSTSSPGRCA
jgi:hypothetical protein